MHHGRRLPRHVKSRVYPNADIEIDAARRTIHRPSGDFESVGAKDSTAWTNMTNMLCSGLA